MKNLYLISACSLLLGLLASCGRSHFLQDAAYRDRVAQDFRQKQERFPQGDLFAIFRSQELSGYEREALEFLYAYMPLADVADYPGEFHLMNVRASQRAASEMPWGRQIPEELFRHFVLPVRVNNEPLDSARIFFYEELKERVRTLSLSDAILEVNHWCHEKAVYRPSDSRTSSPLATVRTAYGRCGEESTLLVAALRAVGIPARQVYTPRWAHTDDNHAWVEAWADGKWHFLGACEPEPVLDLGWFNAPASRGMLMHTKVFGRYEGGEEVMSVTPCHTEINVTANYAPTACARVTVTDVEGHPVSGARVEFKLYNYAEFYTVAHKLTDDSGTCSLTAGRGDMLVWASKEGRFGLSKLSFGQQEALTVVLDKQEGDRFEMDIDLVPPVESVRLPEVTPEQRACNDRRMAREDSIRNAYVGTFPTEEENLRFARRYKFGDEQVVAGLLAASRGNHQVLRNFMSRLRSDKSKLGGIDLLQQLSDKDLRDVTLEVLLDHMLSHVRTDADNFRRYVRNPRVSNETLTPYKAFFKEALPAYEAEAWQADPQKLVEWVSRNIRIDAQCNPGCSPITPAGVWKARVADVHSRDIFFVSLARSLGLPARVDEVTGKVQLIIDNRATDVELPQGEEPCFLPEEVGQRGRLSASYTPIRMLDNPKYYTHFTLSKLTSAGRLQLLNYAEEEPGKNEGTTWANLLKQGTALDAGDYLLVTGTRLANGTVLSHAELFQVAPDRKTQVALVMRESKSDLQVIGNFNSESLFTPVKEGEGSLLPPQTLLQTCGRGYFVVGILGVGQEPTNHALRDIAAQKDALERWGRPLVLLFPDESQLRKFRPEEFPGLPATIRYGIDTDGIAGQIADNLKLKSRDTLPLFIIADTFNRVVFLSQGYTIGLGEQLCQLTIDN